MQCQCLSVILILKMPDNSFITENIPSHNVKKDTEPYRYRLFKKIYIIYKNSFIKIYVLEKKLLNRITIESFFYFMTYLTFYSENKYSL